MPAPGAITISVNHAVGSDFDWDLYRGTGSAIASGRSGSTPDSGTYQATVTGRHYIKLTAYRGSGSYTLDVAFGGGTGGGTRPAKPGNLQAWITGNAADSGKNPVNGPALMLMGGGTDVDASFSQRAFPVANGGSSAPAAATATTTISTRWLPARPDPTRSKPCCWTPSTRPTATMPIGCCAMRS